MHSFTRLDATAPDYGDWQLSCQSFCMSPDALEPVTLSSSEELTFLAELLNAQQARLLVGIRHTFHREYRDELRRRLDIVERLISRTVKAPEH